MHDFLLDGTDNYPSDREACRKLMQTAPNAKGITRIGRDFLQRAVHYLSSQCGVRQFIDHGSGLPVRDNVHQVAQRIHPNTRVVYIDNDPIVLAHGRLILEENTNTTIVEADICNTDLTLNRAGEFLDLNKPVAALFGSVLHCIPDEENPWQLVRDVTEHLVSGSYVVICHLAGDDPHLREEVSGLMRRVTQGAWGRVRAFAEIDRFFEGLEPVGEICDVSRWKAYRTAFPRSDSRDFVAYGGVARVP